MARLTIKRTVLLTTVIWLVWSVLDFLRDIIAEFLTPEVEEEPIEGEKKNEEN